MGAWILRTGAALAMLLSAGGCIGNLAFNQTEELSGNIAVQFVNNTSFRASFTFGMYDSLEKDPPGAVSLFQQRLEGNASTTAQTLPCRRVGGLATQRMIQRVLDTNGDSAAGFDDAVFGTTINFSSAPADSDAATLPTEGTAQGLEVRLGVDFTCGDLLIFTLEESDSAPGGFRVTFQVIEDEEDDA